MDSNTSLGFSSVKFVKKKKKEREREKRKGKTGGKRMPEVKFRKT